MNDTVRKAQQSISTPVPEFSTYKGGQIYQATAFLTRQEETEAEIFSFNIGGCIRGQATGQCQLSVS